MNLIALALLFLTGGAAVQREPLCNCELRGGPCHCGVACPCVVEKAKGRILVVCSTQACLPCRRLEQTLDAYSWPVRVIKLKDAPEFGEMGVTRFPTLILAEADGTIIETRTGDQTRAQLARWLYR